MIDAVEYQGAADGLRRNGGRHGARIRQAPADEGEDQSEGDAEPEGTCQSGLE